MRALAGCLGLWALAAQTPDVKTIESWRQQHEAELRTEDGWLTLTGLIWLQEILGERTYVKPKVALPPKFLDSVVKVKAVYGLAPKFETSG